VSFDLNDTIVKDQLASDVKNIGHASSDISHRESQRL